MKIRMTLADLARLTGGEADGDSAFVLEGVAGLEAAGPKDLSFLGNPKYGAAAAGTKAGCLLLPAASKDLPCGAANRIFVEDPQYAFSLVLNLIAQARPKPPAGRHPKAEIHSAASVAPDAAVGAFTVVEAGAVVSAGARIGPLCFIGENVRIGKDALIHPRVVVREDCVIGDRVVIQPGAVVGGDGYGFSTDKKTGRHRKIPQLGNVVIGDDVEIGSNVTIDRATVGSTVVGEGTKIDNLVMLAHNVKTGRDCLIVSQVGVSGSTVIGDRVILAGQAGLIGHLKIGDGAIVLAQTGVMGDVEKGAMIFGSPSRPHREAMKLQALCSKLPELFDAVKDIKKKLGLAAPKSGAAGGRE